MSTGTPMVPDPLLQREVRFRGLFENAHVPYHEIDQEGKICLVNQAECAMLGYSREEMLGRPVWEFIAPEERDEAQSAVRRKLGGEQNLSPARRTYLCKDGQKLQIEFYENFIQDQDHRLVGIRAILLNVTARKRAEKALEDSEARYRALFENVLEGVYQSTPDGRIITANPALVQMLGYQSERDFIGVDIARDLYIDPGQRDRSVAILDQVGEIRTAELTLRRKDGRPITVLESARAVRDDAGRVVYYEGTLTDVTELVETRRALTAERDFTSAVIEAADALIIVWDTTARIVRFNAACERASGYSFAEVQGKSFLDLLISPEDRGNVSQMISRILSSGAPVKHENAWRTRSGESRYVSWTNATMKDPAGNVAFIISIGIDVTERRLAEERYRVLCENATDIIYSHDLRGNLTSVNAAAERVTGYSREEALGMNVADFVAPQDLPGMRARLAAKLVEAPAATCEVTVISKLGHPIALEVSARLQKQAGEGVSIEGIARDVTERRLAEEKLARFATELQEKNRELGQALAAAREATELKSRFLATMSHEIRTPMNGVLGMTELLMTTDLNAEQLDYTDAIRQCAEALLRVINDILDFSKIEAGKLILEDIPFDLHRLVEEAAILFAPRAAAKGIELMCFVDPRLPGVVSGDPGRIRQILLNLLGNAIKFTDRGEVELRAGPGVIDGESITIEFSVRDTGIGIELAQADRLFESFVQGDGSTTRKYGGTGLGLAISRQLVEAMGGAIRAESTPGQGSTFRFTARFGYEDAGDPAEPFGGSGARALVVEGNKANRENLGAYLSAWGFRPEYAADIGEAVALARVASVTGDPYRVAILDGAMAGPAPPRKEIEDAFSGVFRILSARPPLEADPRWNGCPVDTQIAEPTRPTLLREILAAALHDESVQVAPHAGPARGPWTTGAARGLVLLVEDTPVDRELIVRILQKAGFRADVVSTVEEAAVAAGKYRYELILASLQAASIRDLETIRGRLAGEVRVPVIALSSSADAAEKGLCIAAGLDDYIPKPVQVAELRAALAHWAK